MSQHNDNMDNQTVVWVALALIIMLVIPAIYAAKAGYINDVLLSLARLQLRPFASTSSEASMALERISRLDPAALSWEQMQGILHYCGTWSRWPMAVILALAACMACIQGRTSRLVRRFNMESLLKNNAECFPCLMPVVGRGKYLLSPESYDSGLWRIARTPLQFALEQRLLYDPLGNTALSSQIMKNGLPTTENDLYGLIHLDEGASFDAFQKQLGSHFTGFGGLSDCRKAAAAAFLAYAGGDKQECVTILDMVSLSYQEKGNTASCAVLQDERFIQRLTTAWGKHKKILGEPLLARHAAYELPWFMALLTRARKKGVLASSQFLWLRPMDRPLWYTLNQCGGRAAWAEGFAPWAHYMAEERTGKALAAPRLDEAVASLRDALDSQGWLIPEPIHDSVPAPAPKKTATPPKSQNVIPQAEGGIESLSAFESLEDSPLQENVTGADAETRSADTHETADSPQKEAGRTYAEAEDDPEI